MESYFTDDVPVANLERTGMYFIKLLEGTLKEIESDARFNSEKKGSKAHE